MSWLGIISGSIGLAVAGGEASQGVRAITTQGGAEALMLIPVLTIGACILCGIYAALGVRSKLPAWTSVLALAGSFACVLFTFLKLGPESAPRIVHGFEWIQFAWGNGPGQALIANFAFYVDALTLLWMLFVSGLATLIALYASEYMAGDVKTAGYARFFAAFNLFVFSMSCLVMGDNMLLLFLGWEGVGLCSYLLIGYFYKKPSAVAAAKKAFIVNRIGDLGLALGVMLTFVHFGSLEYASIFANADFAGYLASAKAGNFAAIPWQVQLIPILLMIGAFGKSAQLPLYVWLPDAMEGPTPVSALIHAATMVTAGVYLIARTYLLFQFSPIALPIVAWVGTLTALLAATIGMAQFDIKRIMAYSTVSQLGYMFAGLGVLTSVGAAFHVFTHAFFKALLFLACGAVMHGFAGQLDLRKLSGVRKMAGWAVVSITMLIGCLNLAGFPLITAGYWSKDMILAQAFITPGMQMIGWILLLTAGLTAYYTFRVYFRVFEGPEHFEPGDEVHGHGDGHGDGHGAKAHRAEAHSTHEPHAANADAHSSGHDGGHYDHNHGHHGFHPHAPGWAINLVLTILAVASFAVIPLYFMGEHGGWAGQMVGHSSAAWTSPGEHHGDPAHTGGPHADAAYSTSHAAAGHSAAGHHETLGTFLGFDPHKAMYYVSGIVGIVGIGLAWFLHLAGRTEAARSRADGLLPALGTIAKAAQHKWYVDEIYNAIIRLPLLVASHILHLLDKLLVDGLVNGVGAIPKAIGNVLRPSQAGVMHGYATAMVGGAAVLMIIVLVVSRL
jgi:NADH-quinone oxidoreductase subunit L